MTASVEVTQNFKLNLNPNQAVDISYTAKNIAGTQKNIDFRVMVDTCSGALDDAPGIFINDTETLVETRFDNGPNWETRSSTALAAMTATNSYNPDYTQVMNWGNIYGTPMTTGPTGGADVSDSSADNAVSMQWDSIQLNSGESSNKMGIILGYKSDYNFNFHIGANKNQTIGLLSETIDTTSLGLSGVAVNNRELAEITIGSIDSALTKINGLRSQLGAMQNRLEHIYNFNGSAQENQQSAESRIRDVDMASEMVDFTKNQILSQASQSMLTQANMQPQSVLKMLQAG